VDVAFGRANGRCYNDAGARIRGGRLLSSCTLYRSLSLAPHIFSVEIMRAFFFFFFWLVEKPAFATSVATGAASTAIATVSGLDPWPWVLATCGMVYMIAKTEPHAGKSPSQMRREALGNGMVSLICGGLGGPATASMAGTYNETFNQPYLLAFLISAFWQVVAFKAWPWVLAEVWPLVKSWFQKKTS